MAARGGEMSSGFVYVLSNPSMPGIVKIGKTTRLPSDRASELYKQSSGVPEQFKVEFAMWTQDCDDIESCVHESLDEFRVNQSREFFSVAVFEAVRIVFDSIAADEFLLCAVDERESLGYGVLEYWALELNADKIDVCLAINNMDADDVKRIYTKYVERRRIKQQERSAANASNCEGIPE
jgi:hypothetical protein